MLKLGNEFLVYSDSSNLMEIISFSKDLLGVSFEIAVIQDMLEVEFGIIDHQHTLRVVIQGL